MDNNEIRLQAKDLNQQAYALIESGNFEKAQKKLDEAIELDPMVVESYKNYGDLYMALEEFEDAKNMYKKALLIEKNGEFYFLYGNACFMQDDVHEGLENYNLALTHGFDNEDMIFFMGMAYEHLNDDQMALRYFQKACNQNPSRPDFLIKKIEVLVRLDMMDSAEADVELLIQNNPEYFDGYHIKIAILLEKEEVDQALEFAKMATERFPEDIDLLIDYVRCLVLKGDYESAEKEIKKARQMKYFEESKRDVVILEAEIAADREKVEDTIELCKECISLESEEYFESEARFMLLNMYLTYPKYEDALRIAIELIDNDAEDMYYYAALYYRPFCLKELGKKDEALVMYKEANSIFRMATIENPAAVDIYLYRVMCFKDMEEYDKAIELIDFIYDIAGDLAELHTLKADIYKAQGKDSLAKEEMEKAFEIKPELKEAYGQGGE